MGSLLNPWVGGKKWRENSYLSKLLVDYFCLLLLLLFLVEGRLEYSIEIPELSTVLLKRLLRKS